MLSNNLAFVNFRVGGSDFNVDLKARKSKRGITFEAPRNSLMTAIDYEIFDDLLIGNFMKTTLHGIEDLYPWFTPAVAKYGDNGRAFSRGEVLRYFGEYLRRQPRDFILHQLEHQAKDKFRTMIPKDAKFYGTVRKYYYMLKGQKAPVELG